MHNVNRFLVFIALVLAAAACDSKQFNVDDYEANLKGATDKKTDKVDPSADPTPTTPAIEVTPTITYGDLDNDGYTSQIDCDDTNKMIHPGAKEDCDGVDNNCDGVIDEGMTMTVFADADQDGFGLPSSATVVCKEKELPKGFAPHDGDCNDSPLDANADGAVDGFNIHPGAEEVCDNIDNNCDGVIDEGCAPTPTTKKFELPSDAEGSFWIMIEWPSNEQGQAFMGVEFKAVCEIGNEWDINAHSPTNVVEAEIKDASSFCGLRFNTAYADSKWLAMGNGADAKILKDAHVYILTANGKKTEVTSFVEPWPDPNNEGSSAILEWGNCK